MRYFVLAVFLSTGWAAAQSLPGAAYQSAPQDRAAAAAAPAIVNLRLPAASEVRLGQLSEAEQATRQRGHARNTGVVRTLTGAGQQTMHWAALSDGRMSGRLSIESAGARTIRLHFTGFDAAQGQVWVRDEAGTGIAGPYSGRGPYGDGEFWSQPLAASRVYVDWAGPAADSPQFQIDRMSHAWMDGSTAADPERCQLDVACYPEIANEEKAVANIEFVGDDGGLYLCSGALINTKRSSFAPLFLTANHCVSTETEARSVVSFWSYEKLKCGDPPPDMSKATQIAGAHLATTQNAIAGDFSLLKLTSAPSGAYQLGWSATDPPVGDKVIGIHHPGGPPTNYKRVTFGTRDYDRIGAIYIGDLMVPEENFLQVNETEGRTEPGSSGSPLLNAGKQVIGVLSYGPVPPDGYGYCDMYGQASYGKFSLIYPQIRGYLEELPPPKVSVDKQQFNFRVVDGVAQAPQRQQLTITTDSDKPAGFTLTLGAPWLAAEPVSGAVSASAPATVNLFVSPSAAPSSGTFSTTATINLSSSVVAVSDPVPATVTANLQAVSHRAAITAAVAPNPVFEDPTSPDGYNFMFSLVLVSDADIRITSMSFEGMNLSNRIVDFFGSDLVPGGSSLRALLNAHLDPSPTERVFEFAGYVPSTGAQWTAQAHGLFLPGSNSGDATLTLRPAARRPAVLVRR